MTIENTVGSTLADLVHLCPKHHFRYAFATTLRFPNMTSLLSAHLTYKFTRPRVWSRGGYQTHTCWENDTLAIKSSKRLIELALIGWQTARASSCKQQILASVNHYKSMGCEQRDKKKCSVGQSLVTARVMCLSMSQCDTACERGLTTNACKRRRLCELCGGDDARLAKLRAASNNE